MKTAYLFFLIILVSGCHMAAQHASGTVDILAADDSLKMNTLAVSEVKVSHGVLNTQGYKVEYAFATGDTMETHGAFWGSDANFNKASYQWEDDTTVSIRLYDSVSNSEAKFKVFGKGNHNGLQVDK